MPTYLLLKHYRGGPEQYVPSPPTDQWAPEDVEAHMAFLKHVAELLEEKGEFVDAQALTPAHVGAGRRARRGARHHRRPCLVFKASPTTASTRSRTFGTRFSQAWRRVPDLRAQ